MPKLIGLLSAKLKSLHSERSFSNRSTKYTYQPISDSRNIRLLTIDKGDESICISLIEAALDVSVYDALSYTWGCPIENGPDSPTARIVKCNNERLQVTENLYQALLQFRTNNMTGPFWIDAVCINQDDLAERSSQVRMMGDIYAKSRSVIVWLGVADTETEEAISLITNLSNAVSRLECEIPSWKMFAFNDRNFYDQVGLEPFSIPQWKTILRLLARRWFRRLWVLQEVVLGKPTNVVIGPYALQFDILVNSAGFLIWSGWVVVLNRLTVYPSIEDTRGPLRATNDLGLLLIHTSMSLDPCNGDGPEHPSTRLHLERVHGPRNADERRYAHFLMAIAGSRIFNAQDPRDHIFAPLSLVSRFAPSHPDTTNWIIPDYSWPVRSVFTAASTLFMKRLLILSLLPYKEDMSKRRQAGLPSWVPDFSCPLSTIPLNYISRYDIYESLDPFDDRGRRVDDLNQLHVSVSIRGLVNKVSKPIEETLLHNTFDTLLELVSTLPETGPHGQGRLEVLWRTLVGDCLPSTDDLERNFPAPIELEKSFYNHFRYQMVLALLDSRADDVEDAVFWQNHTTYERFAMGNSLPGRREIQKEADAVDLAIKDVAPGAPYFMTEEYSYGIRDFQNAFQRLISGRTLLVTNLGDLGLGPLSTRCGDVIAYIRNAKVPTILRKSQSGNFEVIGEAYIHGFMHGEILHQGPIQFEDIILE